MNSDLSPAWQNTNDEVPVNGAPSTESQTVSKTVKVRVGSHRVSRTPAAIVGILMVAGLGFSLFEGSDGLIGQIPGIPAKKLETVVEIRITETGIVPRTVDVNPGQKIIWINEQDIPHILESETLLGENGSFLYTPAIFPGSEQEFWISEMQEPGRHSYLSTTSVDIFGELNVIDTPIAARPSRPGTPAQDEEWSEMAALEDLEDFPEDEEFFDEEEIAFEEEATEEEEVAFEPDDLPETIDDSDPLAAQTVMKASANEEGESVNQDALLPYNPYTVGGDKSHPFDEKGEPLHGGAPLISRPGFKPYRNVDTGPALWIVSIGSIVLLAWVTRRSFYGIK